MTSLDWLLILFLFTLGACVGSFLNVVVWRLPRAQTTWESITTLFHPPSHCPKCDTPLAWYDNIPVFGWIMLRGHAEILTDGTEHDTAQALLRSRYRQLDAMQIVQHPVIAVRIERTTSWGNLSVAEAD